MDLMTSTLKSLKKKKPAVVPVFDKSKFNGFGDRLSKSKWKKVKEAEFIIVEGWMLGAKPINNFVKVFPDLEKILDPELEYAKKLNQLLKRYSSVWKLFDEFWFFDVPDVSKVYEWRILQEKLLVKSKRSGMTPSQVRHFVDLFIPFTLRYVLPLKNTSDVVIEINKNHDFVNLI